MSVTVMSFNTQHCMNYITREIDFDLFADTIRSLGADIVGLNEMRDEGMHPGYQAQAKILAEKLGFFYYFAEAIKFLDVNPYGKAIISRYPILSAETIPVPDPVEKLYDGYYETRCLLKAKIDAPGGPLTVCVIHFGLNPDEHQNAVNTVMANVENARCVLMGDFNMTPDNVLLRPIQDHMADTAELFPENLLSFPSDKPECKIDYIFTSKDMTTLSADIPAVVASDHRPYTAVLA